MNDTTITICPRCEGFIPNNNVPGVYPGMLSRTDNETEICLDCGLEEAVDELPPKSEWPIDLKGDWIIQTDHYLCGVSTLRNPDRRSARKHIENIVAKEWISLEQWIAYGLDREKWEREQEQGRERKTNEA